MTRFIARRTSYRGKPCDEAYEFTPAYRWHCRTVTEDEFNSRFSAREGLWRDNGLEHTTYDNGKCIKRKDVNKEAFWVVDIDDIMAFAKKYGSLVVSPDTDYDMPEIEIYDGYRE